MLAWLLSLLPQEEIGWKEIGEEFRRFTLLKTPWFRIYLHRLKAETAHDLCHSHPWSFVTFLLRGGYSELHEGVWTVYGAGTVLFRPAEWEHNVVTRGTSWSLVFTGAKRRAWGFVRC